MTRKLVIHLKGASIESGDRVSIEGVSLHFFATFAERLRNAYQRSAQAVLQGTSQEPGRPSRRMIT